MHFPRPLVSGGLAPWQLRLARDTINANLDGDFSLEQIARECRLSVSHFARAFTRSTGISPHRWLMQRRVEVAKDLMLTTDYSQSKYGQRAVQFQVLDRQLLAGNAAYAGSGARAPEPPRHRAAAACCSRMPSVNTSNPGMLRFCASSINPRRLRPSMSAAFWLRKEPPPNNLISRRCSDLVNSSQGIVGILMVPER
jgi:AraC-like DNA-binding protein